MSAVEGKRKHFAQRNALAHAGKSGRRVVSAFIGTAFAHVGLGLVEEGGELRQLGSQLLGDTTQDDAEAARLQWRASR